MTTVLKQAPTSDFRLGLEKEGLQMFESSFSTWEIPFTNGKFQTGLTPEEIEKVENYFNRKFNDPADFDFWNNYVIEVKHTLNPYDLNNPKDLLEYSILKQLKVAAPSLEEAQNPMASYLFVLHNDREEQEIKATLYEKVDTAIVDLNKLRSTPKHLLAVAKYILPSNTGIGENTSIAYAKLRELINGDLTDTRNSGVNKFMQVLNMDKQELYATVDFRQAVKENIVRKNMKQYYYNPLSQTVYGKNESEAIKFLLNPKNQDELGLGTKSDPNYSIRAQLKSNN